MKIRCRTCNKRRRPDEFYMADKSGKRRKDCKYCVSLHVMEQRRKKQQGSVEELYKWLLEGGGAKKGYMLLKWMDENTITKTQFNLMIGMLVRDANGEDWRI